MSGVSINVSEKELRFFSENVAKFERQIVGDCEDLNNALSRLSVSVTEDELFAIKNAINKIVGILEESRPKLAELSKRAGDYAELVARLKNTARDDFASHDSTVRTVAGVLFYVIEKAAGQGDPTGTVKDAFCDFAEIFVPFALEKGPSLAENMHASYGNPESQTFFRTHFLRDENGTPLTAEEAAEAAFRKLKE